MAGRAAIAAGIVLAVTAGGQATASARKAPGRSAPDYASAPFTVATHSPSFGQAPVFIPGTRPLKVAYGQDFKQGEKNQVYLQNFDGSGPITCLTCSGPGSSTDNVNGVPAVSPDGRWIIFHSWRGHYMTIGSPGYGGMGSALWAMHPDGSDQTQLTDVYPPSASPGAGEGIDDYHAYWSPDGRHIVYAHLNWNFVTAGGQGKWDVRVADFNVGANGVPYLSNIRVVRPANGHWYETQWWNPDPRQPGFLYTESYGKGDSNQGAVTPQLFYCKLLDNLSRCAVTRLSDDPAWDEQALFTPDGKDVIFMSSRDHPGFFNTWATETRTLGLPADYDYLGILPVFELGFLQPVGQESTDLYEINLRTRAVRRLTSDGDEGWITPEFTWDPSHKFLLWTENRFPDGYRYQFPVDPNRYLQQLQALAQNPPGPGIVDYGQNGVGVAPLPLQQRTRIGVFALAGSAKHARKASRHKHRRGR